ncbi:hypothetical protein COS75_00675 [Candidatus Pacearchaeota archaeon CG06_land_8_20_14_3_00_35_12]|nr:MAG: hypothetical protein COS75_00675 [Candidatus Pacearchaeota archaeon CG06_land_8_20_14_3_00_35_12]
MEVNKKAIYYRLGSEESIEAKKQVLQSIIASIEIMKTASNLKRLGKDERESSNSVQKIIEEIGHNIKNLTANLPEEEIHEHKIEHKKSKKAKAGKVKFSEARQFEDELKEIKDKLSKLG